MRSYFHVVILLIMFFFISLLTNIIGPLVPDIIQSFHLSLTMAAFLPFSFFIAYAFMSIPSGMVIEKWGEKPVMLGSFILALAGSLLFCLFPNYPSAILSLFLIGAGMASLQVAVNPLLRVSGGEEHYAFNAVLAQFMFGSASFVSPLVYRYFIEHKTGLTPENMPWVMMYWLFSAISIGMVVLVIAVKFPRVERTEEERAGAWDTHVELLRMPVVWLFFLGIFFYVGLEQGLSNWISEFLATEHGFNPQVEGANAVAGFWGMMTVGCLLGLLLLKLMDSKNVLLGFTALGLAALTVALFGPKEQTIYAFAICGFALSVMWSIIFSLALNSLPKNHGTFSGILCTGIVGGALIPLIVGSIGDAAGLRWGLCVIYIPLLYIASIGLWAKPLVKNKTLIPQEVM
jgi:FHS family L-fucose permease-like MFS transporter